MTTPWTPEAIRALGATTDLPTLGSIFGLGPWRSRQMAHTGEWEKAGIRIIHIGARYRVTVQSILEVLSQAAPPATDAHREQSQTSQEQPTQIGDRTVRGQSDQAAGGGQ